MAGLTNLATRIEKGESPNSVLSLLSATTLLPLQQKPGKILPIAIRSVLRRMITKKLFPTAIDDSHDFLTPFQTANGMKAGTDAIVHDVRKLLRRVASDPYVATVLTDAHKSLNRVDRQAMLDVTPVPCPLARTFRLHDLWSVPAAINYPKSRSDHPR